MDRVENAHTHRIHGRFFFYVVLFLPMVFLLCLIVCALGMRISAHFMVVHYYIAILLDKKHLSSATTNIYKTLIQIKCSTSNIWKRKWLFTMLSNNHIFMRRFGQFLNTRCIHKYACCRNTRMRLASGWPNAWTLPYLAPADELLIYRLDDLVH